jgi:hypothetical protein
VHVLVDVLVHVLVDVLDLAASSTCTSNEHVNVYEHVLVSVVRD